MGMTPSPNGANPKALNGNCTNKEIFTVAGTTQRDDAGFQNGPANQARFNHPGGLNVDRLGNIYVADIENHVIRKITPQGIVSTLAGQVGIIGYEDGIGSNALFNTPVDVVVDFEGNLFVADQDNNVIRKITPTGLVSTYAGNGFQNSVDGVGTGASFH